VRVVTAVAVTPVAAEVVVVTEVGEVEIRFVTSVTRADILPVSVPSPVVVVEAMAAVAADILNATVREVPVIIAIRLVTLLGIVHQVHQVVEDVKAGPATTVANLAILLVTALRRRVGEGINSSAHSAALLYKTNQVLNSAIALY